MNTKDSKLYSVIHQTCPRCHQGKMFASSTYCSQFMKMNKNCPHCGFVFIQEPSYYFGAMYFSYAIQLAVFVMVYFILRYTIDPDSNAYIVWTIISVVLILPLNYRISRVMWINLFVSYQASSKTITNKL